MERKVRSRQKFFFVCKKEEKFDLFVFLFGVVNRIHHFLPAQQQQEYNTFYLIIIIIILMPATTRRQASSLSPRVVREMTPSPRYKGVLKNSGFNFYPMGKVLTFWDDVEKLELIVCCGRVRVV